MLQDQKRYRVALYTMGCKTNQYDSGRVAAEFASAGFQLVPFHESADVYVINTCTVTAEADREARSAARRALARSPEALVVATGCYPGVDAGAFAALPGVQLVGGNDLKPQLVARVCALLASREPGGRRNGAAEAEAAAAAASGSPARPVSPNGRTRQVVKVEEGCNYRCAYCVVPYARGKARSRPLAEILAEVRQHAEEGCREVVLTGTCIGSFGHDLSPQSSLAECAAAVAAVPGIARVRISSIEPWQVTDALVALVAENPVLCPHFHLPLQSADDSVRRRMRRPGTSARFADLVAGIRARLPEAGITTDVIVGFPGESDAAFAATRDFCQQMAFSRLHVFRYSPRPFTPAAELPDQVPKAVAEARSRELIRLGNEQSEAFARRWLGRVVSVLVEGPHGSQGWQEGLTGNYVRVRFTGTPAARGTLVNVAVEGVEAGCLLGKVQADD